MAERADSDPGTMKDWPEQVIGGKYVRLLRRELDQLRSEQTHGNRQLFFDDVFVVHLLAFFNPSVRTLRTIEDFSQTRQVHKHLSLRRICKSTLSDFHRLADPERLEPILQGLRRQLARKQCDVRSGNDDLHQLLKNTVAVDGTFLPAVAEVAWAVANSNNHGTIKHRARVDLQLNVSTWIPEAMVVPEPGQSEADSAIMQLQPGRIYLYDRGFMSFPLLAAHYDLTAEVPAVKSTFVVRYRLAGGNSPQLIDCVERKLNGEDVAAGIVSDRVGRFRSSHSARHPLPDILLREVIVQSEQDGITKTLRLITNLLDVSAGTVALLYRYRWQVELFIRWLKSVANFNHLISHCRAGMLTHLYVTIIAVLLMYLHTGYRPSKYLFSLLSLVAAGSASVEEILPILRRRERQCALQRAAAARRHAKKSS